MAQVFNLTVSDFSPVMRLSLVDVCVLYTPESCLTVPKTLLPASTCCPGYQSVTKPHESPFHFSAAPERLVRKTDLHSAKTFGEFVCVCHHGTCSFPTVKPFMKYQNTRMHWGPVEAITGLWRSVVWP